MMKLVDKTVIDFLDAVNSPSPAPGGGSVSALSGVLAAGLARMVGHLTIPKKSFAAFTEEEQALFRDAFDALDTLANDLTMLVDKDTEAFNKIMQAFKLPKTNDHEKQARSQAIQEATILATEVPLTVARRSIEVLELLPIVVQFGNKNCLSDVGVAALQALSAIQGALMNVKINLPGIKDETIKKAYQEELDTLWETSFKANKIIEEVYNTL
jgi:formiminotetrahydrofolate cyclodeaminase